ncbi:hypothetical protein JCM3774_005311 [Rhodotorula dairenensis]
MFAPIGVYLVHGSDPSLQLAGLPSLRCCSLVNTPSALFRSSTMETFASRSLNTISYLSPANRNVFPKLCNAAGWTDVDAYCAKGTTEICCGLCPNVRFLDPIASPFLLTNVTKQTNVNGPGQFIWCLCSYAIAALAYTLAPSEVWGVAVMQNLNAHAFIVAGMIRVLAGAETGAMAKYMTQFLWPQALGFIFIMAPAILAPQWLA